MAAGDEWIYVPSRQEQVKEEEATEIADAATAAGEEMPSKSSNNGDGQVSHSPRSRADDDAAATTDEAGASTDGEDEALSDGGSYASTEVSDHLKLIEGEEEVVNDAATGTGDGSDGIMEELKALKLEEACAAAETRASGNGGRGKAVVMENPYYDCYGGQTTDAEAYYDYGGYGSGSGSASRGYGPGSGSDSSSRGYGPGSGSGSGSSRGYGPGYMDRYGGIAGYGYNSYGYGGDAYGYGPGYGGDAYGSGPGYGEAYGYGYGGYYGGAPYAPRYPPVVYRAPYPPAAVPYMYCQYLGPRPAYAPPAAARHPPRAGEPAGGPPQPDFYPPSS